MYAINNNDEISTIDLKQPNNGSRNACVKKPSIKSIQKQSSWLNGVVAESIVA
jgi:hypothetical protein